MAGPAFLEKKNTVARPGYSKWLIPPAALCVHLSIGQVYAFSVFKTSLVQRFLDPAELASLVAYLASPLSSATNGSALRADGGTLVHVS